MLFDKLIEGKQCLFFISCSRNYDPDVFFVNFAPTFADLSR